jgi:hypothetical protein
MPPMSDCSGSDCMSMSDFSGHSMPPMSAMSGSMYSAEGSMMLPSDAASFVTAAQQSTGSAASAHSKPPRSSSQGSKGMPPMGSGSAGAMSMFSGPASAMGSVAAAQQGKRPPPMSACTGSVCGSLPAMSECSGSMCGPPMSMNGSAMSAPVAAAQQDKTMKKAAK